MAEEAEELLWEIGISQGSSGTNLEEIGYLSNKVSYYIGIRMK
jgi:hypothetical protein